MEIWKENAGAAADGRLEQASGRYEKELGSQKHTRAYWTEGTLSGEPLKQENK